MIAQELLYPRRSSVSVTFTRKSVHTHATVLTFHEATIICPDDLIATVAALTLAIRVIGGSVGYCV